jgi:steroid 5-alpha reductase family enzyme
VLLYAAGSVIGTASEHARHVWKARPENRGRLCTEGLFRCSRHINYFGDLLLFAGFGLLTRQMWTGMVPLAMGLNFALMSHKSPSAWSSRAAAVERGTT